MAAKKKKALDDDAHDARRCTWCRDEKQSKGPSLAELRGLAKKAFGKDAGIEETRAYIALDAQGGVGIAVDHTDRAFARRVLKAALEAALKG
jgi:hypothetical protein